MQNNSSKEEENILKRTSNYIVLCSNKTNINLLTTTADEDSFVFGPFVSKESATDWIDDECGYKYWAVLGVDMSNTSDYD